MAELQIIQDFIDLAVENPAQAKVLLAKHPELKESRVLHGETILHYLAVEGYADAVRLLGEWGFGDTPLIDVCKLGRLKLTKVLISLGADVNVNSPTWGNPLRCAVRSCNAGLVECLLAAGADPHYVTDLGQGIYDEVPPTEKGLRIEKVLEKFGVRRPGVNSGGDS